MLITPDLIADIFPSLSVPSRATYATMFNEHCNGYDIDTVPRLSAFWAQIGHETGDMRYLAEIWGPTPQQLRYEPPSTLAGRLGNTQAGDGIKYKGRGAIQITGRNNYKQMSEALKVDLISNPKLLETPDLAIKSACVWWNLRRLNEYADIDTEDSFRRMTKIINGGLNGWEDRLRRWKRIKDVLARRAE